MPVWLLAETGQVVKNPVGAAVDTAREALMPSKSDEEEEEQTAESAEVELYSEPEIAGASEEPVLVEAAEMVDELQTEATVGEAEEQVHE